MVMAQSLFIGLKQREPDSQIDVLAPAWTGALIDRMPEVTNLVPANFTHGKLGLGERFKLAKTLRLAGYTDSILLPNSLKSALVPWLSKIPNRIGFLGEQRWGLVNRVHKLDKAKVPMTVQRFVALGLPKETPACELSSIPVPCLKVAQEDVGRVLQKNQLSVKQKILVLCPGAEFGASKQWPDAHYAEVANFYLAKNWQVWLMGSDNDINTCQKLNKLTGSKCKSLAGKTSLPEAIDLISCASLTVSNDSGLMHIAAALQIPLVAVYGSTDPGHTPPLSENHKIARLAIDCSPCFKRECPLQHLDCLNKLAPSVVIGLAQSLLEQIPAESV